jgi:Methyltransferase domain
MQSGLVEKILEYERAVGKHRAGTFGPDIFRAIAEALPRGAKTSLETGCGKSTILLSNISDRHLSFTFDDRSHANGSVAYVLACPMFRKETTEFVFGPTQQTLPNYSFEGGLDVALIDGPHAYPFPELEYYYIYPHLKEGSLLIIDDIHIPTVRSMFAVLREDAMFEPVWIRPTTGILRRTTAPLFDPFGDGWSKQAYNARRYRAPRKSMRNKARMVLRAVGLYEPARRLHQKLTG